MITNSAQARFSLVAGGPFHRLLNILKLTGENRLPSKSGAFVLALLAWSLPALLLIIQTLADDTYSGRDFFSDWTVHTRYLLAIWMMLAIEPYADKRLNALVQHFRTAKLLPGSSHAAFESALRAADRRSASTFSEAVILLSVIVWSVYTAHVSLALTGTGWDGVLSGGESSLSWAGEAARFFSTPLFLFLVMRWFWRLLVWTLLLHRIARLPLQLTPLHPDRLGGLGFLSIYPSVFSGFLFALSCVVAAAMIKDLGMEERTMETVWLALGGWFLVSMALFIGPLLVFVRPLYVLREKSLLEYGRLASQHHVAFHRKWIDANHSGEELAGSDEPSAAADLNATVEIVQQIRFIPVDMPAVIQLLAAAGIPMLAVVASKVSFGELLKWFLGTFL